VPQVVQVSSHVLFAYTQRISQDVDAASVALAAKRNIGLPVRKGGIADVDNSLV
jgi:hypothetical protein